MGRARQLKRMRLAVEAKLYKRLADAPLPPSKTYTDDAGRPLTHREAPSLAWEPMHRGDDIVLPNGEVAEEWQNRWYSCSVRRYVCGFPIEDAPYAIVGWTHASETAHHDWRDAQRIKNDVCGEEWEGLELYPSESRLVDPSNRFYLWCVPPHVVRWGLDVPGRRVLTMAASIAPQRPFPEEGNHACHHRALGVSRGPEHHRVCLMLDRVAGLAVGTATAQEKDTPCLTPRRTARWRMRRLSAGCGSPLGGIVMAKPFEQLRAQMSPAAQAQADRQAQAALRPMPDPTPGQAAYVTWWRTKYGMQQADPASAYQLLPAADRRAWEAAAQAVLDAARATPAGEEEPHG